MTKSVDTGNTTAFSSISNVQEPVRNRLLLSTIPLGCKGSQFPWNVLWIPLLGILQGTLPQATEVRPKHASWDDSCRTCSKFGNFQVLQDFGRSFLSTASTSACILWLRRVLPCFQMRVPLLAQELPMHHTVTSCGIKGEGAVPMDWKVATVLSSHLPDLVSGSKPVWCVTKHTCLTG